MTSFRAFALLVSAVIMSDVAIAASRDPKPVRNVTDPGVIVTRRA